MHVDKRLGIKSEYITGVPSGTLQNAPLGFFITSLIRYHDATQMNVG
jgi:hypothetical protein